MMEGWPSGYTALLTARLPYKYAIPLLAAAFAIAVASTVGSAWAFPDAAQDQTAQQESAPRSYQRGISDGLSVTSNFGNPAAPSYTPRSYTRSLSETVSVASSFQSPSHSALAESQGPQRAPANYSPAAGQRIDERSGNRVLLGNKGDSRINGATQYSGTPQATQQAPAEGDFDFSEMATLGDGGGSEPDDHLRRYIVATLAIDQYSAASSYANAVFGAYSLAAVIIVAARSHRVVRAGRVAAELIAIVIPARQPAASGTQVDRAIVQVKALLIVVVAVLVVISAAGPVVGQAFADSPAGIAYKSGTGNGVNYPKYKEWDPATTSWGAEVELPTSGAELYAVKFLYSPSSSLRVIGTLNANGEIKIYYCDNACAPTAGNWSAPLLVADMGAPTAGYKYFDIAFEASSGDLLIVYDKTTTTDTNDFFYKTFDSINLTLSGESSFDYISDTTSDNDIRFFKMATKSNSDEIAMVLLDATNQDSYAFIWDGNSFPSGGQRTVTSTTGATSISGESIGVAYETASGAAVVFSGNGVNNAAAARYVSPSWTGITTGDPNGSANNDVKWVSMKADPASGSNKVMVCQVDDLTDFTCSEFDAGTAGTWTQLESNVVTNTRRPADFAWDPTGSTGLAIYYKSTGANPQRETWTSSTSTWSGPTAFTVNNGGVFWVVATTDFDTAATGIDSLWALYIDTTTNDIGDGEWDAGAGTPWVLNGETSITADAGTTNTVEVVALDSQKSRNVKRYISDTLDLTNADSINRTYLASRSISEDPITITDSISRTLIVSRSISDTLAVADSIAAAMSFTKSAADTLTITDSITTALAASRSASDTLTVTDSIMAAKAFTRSISDTLTTTDSVAMSVTRSMSDTLTVSDTVGRTLNASRSAADTITMTDSIAMSVARSVADTLTVSDSIAFTKNINRSISDSLTVTDAVSISVTRSTADTLTASDAIAATYSASRSASDTLSVTDSISAAKTFARSISDSVTITDGTARTLLAARSIADSATVTDSIAITIAIARSMSETIAATDSITATYAASRSTSDTLAVTDSIATTNTFSRSAADTFTVTDSIATTAIYARFASDSLTVTDSVSATLTGINRSASDSLAVTDAIAAIYTASRSIADALAIADSISTGGGSASNVSETLPVTDAITEVAVHWNRDFAEAFTLGDCTPFACNQALVLGESLTFGANVTPPPSAADTLAITDSIVASGPVVKGSGRSSANYSVQLADSLAIADKQEGGAFEIIEEFGQKGIRVSITDALGVTSRTISFKTLVVGENVEVNIGVQDVEQASVIPPKAEATIQVQAENSGTDQEKFLLIFSYYDQSGRKAHESSQVVELAPGESRLVNVEVPFTSPGTFDIIAEVRSIPEGELLNTTQLTVTVPWLAINLYLLIVAAAVVLGGSGAAITLFVRSKKVQ